MIAIKYKNSIKKSKMSKENEKDAKKIKLQDEPKGSTSFDESIWYAPDNPEAVAAADAFCALPWPAPETPVFSVWNLLCQNINKNKKDPEVDETKTFKISTGLKTITVTTSMKIETDVKRIPFIIFEDWGREKCKEFIDCIDNQDILMIVDLEQMYNFPKDIYISKLTENTKIGVFTKSHSSMMCGSDNVRDVSNFWYAVHLSRFFTERDLSKSYNDVKTNKTTLVPNKDEDMKTYANRVISIILRDIEEEEKTCLKM